VAKNKSIQCGRTEVQYRKQSLIDYLKNGRGREKDGNKEQKISPK
jgi:hypothetical protein